VNLLIKASIFWSITALLALVLLLGLVGGFDNAIDVAAIRTLAVWRHDSPAITRGMIALTQVGSVYTTLGLAVVAALLLWFRGDRTNALLLFGVVVAERLTGDSMKLLYDRPRPTFDLHPVATSSSSFPSGHSANSMTAFVVIALFAVPERYRRLALTLAIGLASLVGLTRPFLGVHWPSDVVGGWAVAGIFILAARELAMRLAAREPQH
jgi:undecaprenyl-diphosphatase